ncbi:FG-GAP repeat domain-containing protein [Streptomyces platensis]|uniref:FG-GAP repeat domain-containing protein n=1 Tax=Streptomyces platensis TaxID=58346 RepID=UPI0036CB3C70
MPAMIMNGHCKSFNGDGKRDLLVRHDTSGELLVFPHSGKFDGTRTFLDPVKIGTDFSWEKHLIIRTIDIRGNGLASVLAGSEESVNTDHPHGVYLYENKGGLNGLNTLSEPIRMSGRRDDGRIWESIGVADVSGDGKDDTFGRESELGHVDWFRNTGNVVENDTFDKTPQRLTVTEPTDFPFGMADVTGTGRLDLLILRDNGDLCVYEFPPGPDGFVGDGAGQGTWYTVGNLGADWNPLEDALAVTDIDLDGKPDLLVRQRDGVLVAYAHSGTFDRKKPMNTFHPPVAVLQDCAEYHTLT